MAGAGRGVAGISVAQHINLYDPALLRKRDWLALGNVVGVTALLLVLVGLLGYLARMDLPGVMAQTQANESQLKTLRDQVTAIGQQIAQRKPDPRIEQEIVFARLLLDSRSEVLNALRQRNDPEGSQYAEYMRGFARQSIQGLWLTGFGFENGSGAMEIRGRTIDPALLPEYIRRLNREKAFQGRAFAALKLAEGKADAPPTGGQPPAGAPAAAAAAAAGKVSFHEFRLIPVKAGGPGADKAAVEAKAGG